MPTLSSLHSPLLLGAALLYQCVLIQSAGLCPLSGKTHDPRHTLSVALTLAATTATAILLTAVIAEHVLAPQGLDYLNAYVAVLVIALCARAAPALASRLVPAAADTPVPLLTQMAALGVVWIFSDTDGRALHALSSALIGGGLFAALYVLSAAQYERLQLSDVPAPLRGLPIHLLTAGVAALALTGLAGLF
jgi:Na+-translocating ferredoxin:NAD+ oxidoreductase subunit A